MARPKKRNTQRRNLSSRVWRKWIIPVVVVLGVLALVVPTVLPGLIGTPAPASSSALPTEDMKENHNSPRPRKSARLLPVFRWKTLRVRR